MNGKFQRELVYMAMTRTDKGADMSKVSPFLIKRCIDKVTGPVQECKKLRNGVLLIKCNSTQAEKLKGLTHLNQEISVKCEEHQDFNISKGKIFSRDLGFLSDEEIISELADQKVTHVRRIKRRDKETNKLTEDDLGIYRFGHSSEKCKEENKHCPNCSCEAHTNKDESGRYERCENPALCINCRMNHSSLYRKCEVFKKEKEIQYIRVKNKVSYFEARRRYKIDHPLPVTFARTTTQEMNEHEEHQLNPTPSTPGQAAWEEMETDVISGIQNKKTITSRSGKEVILMPRNTPKHKMDKIKIEHKKKVNMIVKSAPLQMNLANNNLNIIQWNCDGFFCHSDELKLLISNLNPFALCLQETKCKTNSPKLKKL